MNVLVLSSRAPSPPKRADQMTVERMLRFLDCTRDARACKV